MGKPGEYAKKKRAEILNLLSAPGAVAREPDEETEGAGAIYRINGVGKDVSVKTLRNLVKAGKLEAIPVPVFSERLGRYIETEGFRKRRHDE